MIAPATQERRPSILVLGGYGAVGQRVARVLAQRMRARITIAGRDLRKATDCVRELQLASPTEASLVPRTADLGELDSLMPAVREQDVIVCCAPMQEQRAENLIEAALRAGADCVEISPGVAKYRVFEKHRDKIAKSGQRFILDAGADPGLPGWLGRYAAKLVNRPRKITLYARYRDTSIGLGGIRDILEHMSQTPKVYRGRWTDAARWWIRFPNYPGGLGRSFSVPVFLEELESVPEETGVQELSLLHGGINPLTDLLVAAYGSGMNKVISLTRAARWFRFAMRKFTPKPFGIGLIAEVEGNQDTARVEVSHPDLYLATAQVVTLAVLSLQEDRHRSGYAFLGQRLDGGSLKRQLEETGFHVRATKAER